MKKSIDKQQGSASIFFCTLLAIGLCISGYFLYDSYDEQATLTTQLDDVNRKLRLKTRALRDAEYSFNEQQSTLSQLNRQREALRDEISNTKLQLSQTKESSTQTQQALKKTTQELQAALAEKELEYEKKLAQVNDFSSHMKQKYQSTQMQLDNELSRIKTYSSTIETLEQRLNREQEALSQLNTQLAILDKKNADLHLEKNRLIKQFKDGTTIIRLDNTILFPSGSAELNQRGTKTLSAVAKTLTAFPNHLISIEGHTDSQPITSSLVKKYPSNWELSSARSAFAIRHLIKKGLRPSQFQAVGFGSTRPLAGSTKGKHRQKNRRIEILLYPPIEKLTIKTSRKRDKNTLSLSQ